MKRNGKFYRNNEAEIMRELGLEPTKNSGSGWIEKEDGQNKNIICQLKSTDANSIKVDKHDLDTLLYNASVTHKIPLFVLNFLQSNENYLVIRPQDLRKFAKYLQCGIIENENREFDELEEELKVFRKTIKSSSQARNAFAKEQEKKYKKGGKSAV